MKTKFAILFFIVGMLSACKKSFLTLTPLSQPTAAGFYKTTADVTNAVSAAYAPLQGSAMYQDRFITLMEARSDNVEDQNPGGNAGRDYNIDRFLAKSDNATVSDAYKASYADISRCNNTLANLDVVSDAALKNQYEGEILFLRALNYFNIVRLWGAAPLILTPVSTDEALTIGRSPIQSIYAAIELDLAKAATLLPPVYSVRADQGRATAGAAKALLGKVYLTQQKWAQSVSTLRELVPPATNPYKYALLPNVADVFVVTNKLNAEVIFAVHYEKTIPQQGHAMQYYFNKPVLDPKLLSSFVAGDTRRDLLNTQTVDANTQPVKKYYDTFDATNRQLGTDFIVLRYADVLLMYAEALNEVSYTNDVNSDQFKYLNTIRTRAKVSVYTSTQLTDQATFRDAVLNERRLELPLELHRWFDLVRTNTAITALQNSGLTRLMIQPYQYLYPVPQSEIEVMKNPALYSQNPGY
ncbi:RagB/SusD family nutrient uptake outer membrane protein [Mucilaginibacter terrae]|uniref:RagB/SusD family nutrient uptake outer membrane protein n=1 Tax=Mucilaginibacter terrae TaxID=1955052 RepID=UPI00362EDA0C